METVRDVVRHETTQTEDVTSSSHEENSKIIVKAIVDPTDGKQISIEEAVKRGILDHNRGLYLNPSTGEQWPIAAAMNDGRIRVERVLTSKKQLESKSIGLITIRVQTDTREYVITGAVDMLTGTMLPPDEAKRYGIVDDTSGTFTNTRTNEKMSLSEAVDAGHVIAEFGPDDVTSSEPLPTETKTYAVSAVVDQKLRRPIPFNDAVRRGIIDRRTGCYINNATGEKLAASEAIRRGMFKCVAVDQSAPIDQIQNSNKVVVDRIEHIRKNVLRNMSVLSAFKQAGK